MAFIPAKTSFIPTLSAEDYDTLNEEQQWLKKNYMLGQLRQRLVLEPFFFLGYYFGMSWETYYDFPIPYRNWLVDKIQEEIKKSVNAGGGQTKSPLDNSPDVNSLMGKFRQVGTQAPSKQRFT